MIATKCDGYALKYASDSFKEERNVVLDAVQNGGYYAIKDVECWKKDREIEYHGLIHSPMCIQYAPKKFKNDRKLISFIIRKNVYNEFSIFEYGPKKIRENRKIIILSIRYHAFDYDSLSSLFKKRSTICAYRC